jgi:hypothetical protein
MIDVDEIYKIPHLKNEPNEVSASLVDQPIIKIIFQKYRKQVINLK